MILAVCRVLGGRGSWGVRCVKLSGLMDSVGFFLPEIVSASGATLAGQGYGDAPFSRRKGTEALGT